MRCSQTHQETCPQVIPLWLLDLERLVKAVSRLWDILMVLWRWFGLRWRLLIGRLLVIWLLVIWLRVWRRWIIWLLIVPMLLLLVITIVGLRLALRRLVIVAGSLSTHICEAERRGKSQKEKEKKKDKRGSKGFWFLHLTGDDTKTGTSRSATQISPRDRSKNAKNTKNTSKIRKIQFNV